VEHGYEDATALGARRYRQLWIAGGAAWWEKGEMPEGWILEEQLEQVPMEFR